MSDIIIPYKPRPLQRAIHDEIKRWNLFVCHRRFGKTVLAINELIKQAVKCEKQNPRYGYVAPLYKQAKQIAWDYLKQFAGVIPGTKFNESELRCDFPWGARVTLYGADNPDSMRGLYLDGVVLDEYADMSPRIFSEVIRPALSDREGWAIFIGSAKGGSTFHELYERVVNDPGWNVKVYRASETGVIDPNELTDARKIMTDDEYEQEYECSWTASIQGAYYAKQMAIAESEGRITKIPYEQNFPVHTFWDLGVGDATSIWFMQEIHNELRFIDYYEASGEGLPHYANVLNQRGYTYGRHYAPHDIEVRELGTGISRLETARNLGIKFDIAPKLGIDDGINAARMIFNRCWFEKDKCLLGIQALRNYRKEYDEKRRQFKSMPYHDWSSHAADAFRYFAVSWKGQKKWASINNRKVSIV